MTSDTAQPLSTGEVHQLADQLAGWVETLSDRQRAALGEVFQRAALAPLEDFPPPGPQSRLLTDVAYDDFFLRLQETTPDLTIPDA